MGHHMLEILKEYGVPGAIGMGLGYWLLGTNVRSGRGNLLGQPPWAEHWAILVGGVAFGWAFWCLFKLAFEP
jgi:hypothetical protein